MKKKFPSELRYDTTSGDWVVIASGRAKRPKHFKKEKRVKMKDNKKDCPFCNWDNSRKVNVVFEDGEEVSKVTKNWSAVSTPNKYPAFMTSDKLERRKENHLYETMNAVGYHEVVITRDHKKSLGELPLEKTKEIFRLYRQRYTELSKRKFVNHVSIFHNHGMEAGASIAHPHSQIITTPLIDIDLNKALSKSKEYNKKQKSCIYCKMNDWEIKKKERIIYENDLFIALCPFASKSAFQVIVSPKKHLAYFEKSTDEELDYLADAFHTALAKLHKGLEDPPYNFYLHCAPSDGLNHDYYHWHWTIIPKTSVWAGFELGARMEISTISPEEAAKYLRNQ